MFNEYSTDIIITKSNNLLDDNYWSTSTIGVMRAGNASQQFEEVKQCVIKLKQIIAFSSNVQPPTSCRRQFMNSGALTYRSDASAPTNTPNQGPSVTICLLAQKGSLGDRFEIRDHWVLNFIKSGQLKKSQRFANFFQNLMILPENFDQKSQNTGSLGVKLQKWKALGDKLMQKRGVYWQAHDVYRPMGVPRVWNTTETTHLQTKPFHE